MRYQALSLKQPWAALLAAGFKSIEVRRWRTNYRGPVLIHAARIPDDRELAWSHVPAKLRATAELVGGIVGVGTLTSCKVYRRPQAFVADQALHLNDSSWFEPRGLFGFCFTGLRELPFRQVPGYVRLFEVEFDDLDLPEVSPAPSPGFAAVLDRFHRLMRSLRKKE